MTPRVEVRPIATLLPANYNPRKISDEALAGLKASIKRFGLVQPIVVNEHSGQPVVVGGHQRLKALQANGETTALVLLVDLPESEEKALNVTMNNPAIEGEFDDGLAGLLEEIKLNLGEDNFTALRLDELIFHGEYPEGEITEDSLKEKSDKIICPSCGHEFIK